MIEETATVVEVSTDHVTVQTQRNSSCKSCAANKGCGTAVLAKTIGQKHAIIDIEKSAAASPQLAAGDQVVIGINESMLMNGSVMAYLLPLAAMIILAMVAQWLGREFGLTGELHIIFSAVAGIVLSIAASRFFFKHSAQRLVYAPVLVRKLQQVTPVRDNILLP